MFVDYSSRQIGVFQVSIRHNLPNHFHFQIVHADRDKRQHKNHESYAAWPCESLVQPYPWRVSLSLLLMKNSEAARPRLGVDFYEHETHTDARTQESTQDTVEACLS